MWRSTMRRVAAFVMMLNSAICKLALAFLIDVGTIFVVDIKHQIKQGIAVGNRYQQIKTAPPIHQTRLGAKDKQWRGNEEKKEPDHAASYLEG